MSLHDIATAFVLKELPDSEVELSGEVPYETFVPYREKALGQLGAQLELPGFRKGHVPADMALKKLGEQAVLEEAAELFIQDFYPVLVETKAVDAVGRPSVRITKLAAHNPVGFVIQCAIYPEVTLPKNWRAIGAGIVLEPALPATEEEVQKTLESLRKSRATKKDDGTEELPEMTDEWAKSLGAFTTLDELKEQIKKGIGEEKERASRDARRGKVVEALLKDTKVAVPQIFVESELDKIVSQMRQDVERMGLKFEDYLKHSGKTEEAIRGEFKEQATKRAKLQLTLNKIATEEKVEADAAAVESEMKHALQHFPDANPELLKIHIETVLKNEKVLQLLEGGDKKE